MIYWSRNFPAEKHAEALERLRHVCQRYFIATDADGRHIPGGSYRERLMALQHKHLGRRCFILGNGPSLARMDLSPLKHEITIGSNGIFLKFGELGFHTTYFTMEDIEQVEDRADQLESVRGPVRLFALYNAHCVPERGDTIFMNVERTSHGYGAQGRRWKELYPQFSLDLASSVFLGATITYINLQLAFFLGCDPIYLIGVDHNYGAIAEKHHPGKVQINEEVMKDLVGAHFVPGYHSVGGRFGVPYKEEQEKAYRKALEVIESYGRKVFNATPGSKLTIFPRAEYTTLFA